LDKQIKENDNKLEIQTDKLRVIQKQLGTILLIMWDEIDAIKSIA
jgi:hypothetical protein